MIDLANNNLSLAESLAKAKPYDTINLGKRRFEEKIIITTPHLTLIGTGATIVYNASHGDIIPFSLGGDGTKTFGTTGSATFTVKKEASFFKAEGITFINSYQRSGRANEQAVAFKSEASNVNINNCQFISNQDTLYLDDGKDIILTNCQVVGDVDFVFGSASALLENCSLVAINDGLFLAPNTYTSFSSGFVFVNCNFKLQNGLKKTVYLGRPWYPSKAKEPVYPRVELINCHIDEDIKLEFIKMHVGDPDSYQVRIIDTFYGDKVINRVLSKK